MQSKKKSTAISRSKKQSKQTPAKAKPEGARAGSKMLSLKSRRVYYAAIALAAIVFACYANSLGNEFVFDDFDLVETPAKQGRFSDASRLFDSYRPLRTISYAVDFAIWGNRPFGFRLTNILIHVASSLLVFVLIRRLTNQLLPSFIGALIFALHPIQTDSVTYISGRRDVLFGFFYLAALLSYLTYSRSRSVRYLALFVLCWGLSLLSKEMAASLPLILFLWNFCDLWGENEHISQADNKTHSFSWLKRSVEAARKAIVKDKWLYLTLLVAAIAYALYMVFLKQASSRAGREGLEYWGGSFYATMLTSVRVHAWYLKQLVFPTPIAQYFGAFEISNSALDWRVLLALGVVGLVLASGFFLLKRRKLMAFAIFSYFGLLAPVSQIIPHHELLADHYLYLPMMSFGLLVALLVCELKARGDLTRKIAYAAAAIAVMALAALTFMRNRVWKDSFTLWLDNYQVAPNSSRATFNLAGQYSNRGNPKKAEEFYLRTIDLDPTLSLAYTNLARLYLSQDRARDAEKLIQRGLTLSDDQIRSTTRHPMRFRSALMALLAGAKGKQGDDREGERLLWEAIKLDPANLEAYLVLDALYEKEKNNARRLEVLRIAIEVVPRSMAVLGRVTQLLISEQKYDEALPYLQRMLEINPSDFYAHYQLGQVFKTKNDCKAARTHLEAALSAASTNEQTRTIQEALRGLAMQCGS